MLVLIRLLLRGSCLDSKEYIQGASRLDSPVSVRRSLPQARILAKGIERRIDPADGQASLDPVGWESLRES